MDLNGLRTLKQDILTAREPRVSLIVNLQLPSRSQAEVLASAATLISTALQDGPNIRTMADAFGLSMNDAYEIFQSLALGEALYKFADHPGPFKIEMPLAPVPDKCDEDKREEKAAQFVKSCGAEPGPAWEEMHKEIAKARASRTTTLNDADIRLLRESAVTYERPLPLKDLAAKVGVGASEATHSSRRLEQLGYGERQEASIGRQRMVFLEPAQKGWDFLGLRRPDGAGRGNAPHRYCLALVENHLRKKGFATRREVEVSGKRIDLVAEKGAA